HLSKQEAVIREAASAAQWAAKRQAEQVRIEVTTPLVGAAQSALAEWRQAEAAAQTAGDQVRAASWFGKRRARDEHEEARAHASTTRHQAASGGREPARRTARPGAWAAPATRPKSAADPRLTA